MENQILCNCIKVTQALNNGILGSRENFCFTTLEGLEIEIQQRGIRVIIIKSSKPLIPDILYNEFLFVDKFLWLCEGQFIPTQKIHFYFNENQTTDLEKAASNFLETRLNCFDSVDFLRYSKNKIANYSDILTPELFSSWKKLVDDLDLILPSMLYSCANSGLPKDIVVAHLIELSESLTEVISLYDTSFIVKRNKNGKRPLRNCIDAIIKQYGGNDIFYKEYTKDNFLSHCVNSRVRIMHIKRNYKETCFNGKEAVLFSAKFILLYQKVLVSLLGVNEKLYRNYLQDDIDFWNQWYDVLENYLNK